MEHQTKTCEYCAKAFQITPEELSMYQKIELEIPSHCMDCRFAQYFAFWPYGKFRKGTSALSGDSLITMLPTNARYPIYSAKEWWSDAWDPMDYGMDYDETRPFFEQLKELQEKVPRPHQQGTNNLGCDWCDDAWDSKNSYLSRSIARCENVLYGYRAFDVKDSSDISHAFSLDNCYDCTYSFNSYNLIFSRNCRDCIDSAFLFDCRNCSNCFLSSNLRGKQFCIENQQYSKEDYFEKIKEFDLGSHVGLSAVKEKYKKMLQDVAVHRADYNINTHNSEGTYMTNCNNCKTVFGWEDSENCQNCLRGRQAKDCIDLVGNWIIELSGNNSCCTESYGLKHSSWSQGRYSEYLDNSLECEYCFGCISLRKKKYCILNKQYAKEEYEALREKIVADMRARGEYGKFLPYSMGLCSYNLTTAAIYMPEITKEYVLDKGGYWEEPEENHVDGISTNDLPDSINEVDVAITKQPLICPETGWRFNISPEEFSILKRKGIALPRVHFDVRTKNRMKTIAPFKGEKYSCMYCNKDIIGYYPHSWGYKNIACDDCYKQNIS